MTILELTPRDALASVIHDAACQCRGHTLGLNLRSRDTTQIADAVLAAGYRLVDVSADQVERAMRTVGLSTTDEDDRDTITAVLLTVADLAESGRPPRPSTPEQPSPHGGRFITVKRACNGCGERLGDTTRLELMLATNGRPLPDVTDECPRCGIDDTAEVPYRHRNGQLCHGCTICCPAAVSGA